MLKDESDVMMTSHTLVITPIDGANPAEVDHWREFDIECPGVTESCREWRECAVKSCPANTGDADALWDDKEAHGERHQYIDSTWMTPTGFCYLVAADELCDVAEELAKRCKLAPGRYTVTHSFDDGRIEYLEIEGADFG